jgi:hypothetical protein
VLASNYGEAGALQRYGHVTAYSGDMGFWWWGPPPVETSTVVAVGYDRDYLSEFFAQCRVSTRLDNHLDLDDDEQGAPVSICEEQRESWTAMWPSFKALG